MSWNGISLQAKFKVKNKFFLTTLDPVPLKPLNGFTLENPVSVIRNEYLVPEIRFWFLIRLKPSS